MGIQGCDVHAVGATDLWCTALGVYMSAVGMLIFQHLRSNWKVVVEKLEHSSAESTESLLSPSFSVFPPVLRASMTDEGGEVQTILWGLVSRSCMTVLPGESCACHLGQALLAQPFPCG